MARYQKLSTAAWVSIRGRYESGESPRALAHEFGVSESTLYRRCVVESWTRPGRGASGRLHSELSEITAVVDRLENDGDPGSRAGEHEVGRGSRPSRVAPAGPIVPRQAAVSATNLAHVETARLLRARINSLLRECEMGAGSERQPQAVKDLAMALERLQRIERLALGMEDHAPQQQQMAVIVVPGKLSPEEWERQVRSAEWANC